MISATTLAVIFFPAFILKFAHTLWSGFTARELDDIPGPQTESWVFGELFQLCMCTVFSPKV
jgi:hypothetical protein